jgi:hypothetical protein
MICFIPLPGGVRGGFLPSPDHLYSPLPGGGRDRFLSLIKKIFTLFGISKINFLIFPNETVPPETMDRRIAKPLQRLLMQYVR